MNLLKKITSALGKDVKDWSRLKSVVSEYYRNAPKEKGKETVFYREMMNMIYSFESTVDNMKMELENPDLISTIDI